MPSCLKKHVLSMLSRGDLELAPHSIYGFRVPKLQEAIEAKDFEIRDTVNELINDGQVELVKEYMTPTCPACGSPDPIARLNCPKCGSANLDISNGSFKCKDCGTAGSLNDALMFSCKTCGKQFTLGESHQMALGRIRLKTRAFSLEPIAESLLKAGALYYRCARLTGKSGYTHSFDFYVRGRGGDVYIDIAYEEGGVKLGTLFEFLTKAFDAGISYSLFIAIPGLAIKVDPGVKWASVLEAGSVEEAASVILNEIKATGIITK